MGREAKLLLGLLATLLGVFVGVLSMKLLVPRPPAGAGPDIHAEVAATEPRDLVEPPGLTADLTPPEGPTGSAIDTMPRSRFSAAHTDPSSPTERDPFLSRASFAPHEADRSRPQGAKPPEVLQPGVAIEAVPVPATRPPTRPPTPGTAYVAATGDSWWSLAEKVYGDGRIYRALFAWNRAIDPRVSLVPGTPIDLPDRDRLEASWPSLLPRP